mmetsp:Transcript_33546/g.71905  ORF Transcript_33546/g.71905 Transcript_33546/m.71905 type:complete len:325 (-) Transcript_33546:479-1453(-)
MVPAHRHLRTEGRPSWQWQPLPLPPPPPCPLLGLPDRGGLEHQERERLWGASEHQALELGIQSALAAPDPRPSAHPLVVFPVVAGAGAYHLWRAVALGPGTRPLRPPARATTRPPSPILATPTASSRARGAACLRITGSPGHYLHHPWELEEGMRALQSPLALAARSRSPMETTVPGSPHHQPWVPALLLPTSATGGPSTPGPRSPPPRRPGVAPASSPPWPTATRTRTRTSRHLSSTSSRDPARTGRQKHVRSRAMTRLATTKWLNCGRDWRKCSRRPSERSNSSSTKLPRSARTTNVCNDEWTSWNVRDKSPPPSALPRSFS